MLHESRHRRSAARLRTSPVDKKLLEHAPGFDKAHWPNMAERAWGAEVSTYYGAKIIWDESMSDSKSSPVIGSSDCNYVGAGATNPRPVS